LPLKEGKYLKLRIGDRGVGIPEEHLPKVFDPYFTTKEKGEGLGLATTYSIIRHHHGHISVESAVGAGTTITLYLPASTEAAEEPRNAKGEVLSGKGNILVMDDDPTIQALASAMLNKLGYDTAVAGNGDEAIALFRSARESHRPFDAVLMDLTIPGGMGGKEAIKHLISIDRQVKAIVSSGYSNDPIMANYQEYGFSGVAAKPYTIQSLSSAIHTVLEQPAS
jgi:CheY-like chemotaxis protein